MVGAVDVLDTDHLRAEIGERQPRELAREEVSEVQDPDACQRAVEHTQIGVGGTVQYPVSEKCWISSSPACCT